MTDDALFLVCNWAVLPAWLLLAVWPRAVWTARVVHSIALPLLLGAAYLWAMLAAGGGPEDGGFGSLAGVTALPAEPITAIDTAHEYAKLNGYDNNDPNIVVTPLPTADNELRVQIDDDIDTFFMKVFGIDTVHIDVAAKARYIAAVPLGNPDNIFGPEPAAKWMPEGGSLSELEFRVAPSL